MAVAQGTNVTRDVKQKAPRLLTSLFTVFFTKFFTVFFTMLLTLFFTGSGP